MGRYLSSIISSLFGKFASKEFNKPLQNFINSAYVKLLKLDMSEFDKPSSYSSLKNLFIRELKQQRVVDASKNSVISPCDSKIIAFGTIKRNSAHQIKGMNYNTNELIGALENSKILEGGSFINFYLSPKDYHRYHMPFSVKVLSVTYIPGKLYPVNMPLLKKKKNLYLQNERVVIELLDRYDKKHFLVLVGALNVGKMVVTFEKRIKTNSGLKRFKIDYKEPILLNKGELFGWFEMGSTIVLLSQKNALRLDVELNSKVKFGDIIGELNEN